MWHLHCSTQGNLTWELWFVRRIISMLCYVLEYVIKWYDTPSFQLFKTLFLKSHLKLSPYWNPIYEFFCPIHVLYHLPLLAVQFLIGNYQYPFQNITTPASWPCNAIRMENGFCRFAYFPDTFSIIPTALPHQLSTLPSGRVRVFIQEDCKYFLCL